MGTDIILKPEVTGKIHFIGIGGISMSGLAETLHKKGFTITGSDSHDTKTISHLKQIGIRAYVGHSAEYITDDIRLVVYTAAVHEDNAEIIAARYKGIPVIDRAALLSLMMKEYEYSVAVSGTHGKTTTTAMISQVLLDTGRDPSVSIGAVFKAIGGNTRMSSGPYFVAEACEYCDSFLKLFPFIGVILNTEDDHLDYFKDSSHIRASFRHFAENIDANGALVVNAGIDNLSNLTNALGRQVITFGEADGDICAANASADKNGCFGFDVLSKGENTAHIQLSVPGRYNMLNALAAYAVCMRLDIPACDIAHSLDGFTGAERRFEHKGEFNGVSVVDDYAHMPTEIMSCLSAARSTAHKRIICAFQPHNYTRTSTHFDEFASSFGDADEVVLLDIYTVREDRGEISSADLARAISERGKKARYCESFEAAAEYLRAACRQGDLLITMGAGDIYMLADLLSA